MKDRNKMRWVIQISVMLLLLNLASCKPTEKLPSKSPDFNNKDRYLRFMFYNVENYFDANDDSLTMDEEFTPDGLRHWTISKYIQKQKKIYQVISALGGWELPEIVGFCEIENEGVIADLLKNTPLKYYDYGIVHRESPDKRGIDVALIYRKAKLNLIEEEFIPIVFPFDTAAKTREILHATFKTLNDDTLHIYINHWPSKLGGQAESDARRKVVAGILRANVDSLFLKNKDAKILISGDFNDEPDVNSITQTLGAGTDFSNPLPGQLYNISWHLKTTLGKGSYKYQGAWGMIDQIIISGSLFDKSKTLYTSLESANVFEADFLCEKDEAFIGIKPFRTFVGFKFNGGFSDHFPVFIDFLDN